MITIDVKFNITVSYSFKFAKSIGKLEILKQYQGKSLKV